MLASRAPLSHPRRDASLACPRSADSTTATCAAQHSCWRRTLALRRREQRARSALARRSCCRLRDRRALMLKSVAGAKGWSSAHLDAAMIGTVDRAFSWVRLPGSPGSSSGQRQDSPIHHRLGRRRSASCARSKRMMTGSASSRTEPWSRFSHDQLERHGRRWLRIWRSRHGLAVDLTAAMESWPTTKFPSAVDLNHLAETKWMAQGPEPLESIRSMISLLHDDPRQDGEGCPVDM